MLVLRARTPPKERNAVRVQFVSQSELEKAFKFFLHNNKNWPIFAIAMSGYLFLSSSYWLVIESAVLVQVACGL
jgi:hypothetical protein